VRDQVSHPYKATGKTTVLYALIFVFLDRHECVHVLTYYSKGAKILKHICFSRILCRRKIMELPIIQHVTHSLTISVVRSCGQKKESQEVVYPLKSNFKYKCSRGGKGKEEGEWTCTLQTVRPLADCAPARARVCVCKGAYFCSCAYSAHIKCRIAISAIKSRAALYVYAHNFVTCSFRLISTQYHLCSVAIYCSNIRPNHHDVIRNW
jgi:hypothetical protein